MNTLNLWIWKSSQKLLIKQKACKRYSKKRCFVFLSFYTFCVILVLLCLKDKLNMDKNENCKIQNISILEMEKNSSQNVNHYLKMFFSNSFMENIPVQQKWTSIANNIYVYSAFFEACPSKLSLNSKLCIKFVGIVLSNSSSVSPFLSTVKCVVKNCFNVSKEENTTIELLPENHFKLFTAAFLFCPVKSINLSHAALYDEKSVNLIWLPIESSLPAISNLNIFSYGTHTINFSEGLNLCVRPMYNDFAIVRFSEFLAYYSVMGVDHFIFYYTKSFQTLELFLNILKYANISNEIHLWDMPLDNDLIHEYGQIAFTQDCIARSKYKFSHTIIVDLDEYIVPQVHENLKSLISYLDNKNTYAGSYVIPMVLFCDEYLVEKFNSLPFHILNYNKREKTYWQHQYRSKYILRPDRIRYSGVHFTWELEGSYIEVFVSPSIALLNHYRLCCGMAQTWFFHLLEFNVLNDKVVTDNTLMRHENKLMNNKLFKLIFKYI